MTVTICQAVLCLPSFSAGSTTPLLAASSRIPVMRNSRLMMTITAHAGMACSGIRQMNAAAISTLSATGSMSLPKSVSSFRFRAISPSR